MKVCCSTVSRVLSDRVQINSSIRHQEEGQSILSDKDFIPSVSGVDGNDALFLSNACSSKLLPVYFQRQVSKYSDFVKNISSWTALSLKNVSEEKFEATGYMSSDRDGDHFVNVFSELQPETSVFASVVPSETFFAASLPLAVQSEYLVSYRKYLDARSRLGTNNGELAALGRKTGDKPDDWARALSVKEVTKAQWRSGDNICEAVLVKERM